jgi:hypothetical protein
VIATSGADHHEQEEQVEPQEQLIGPASWSVKAVCRSQAPPMVRKLTR